MTDAAADVAGFAFAGTFALSALPPALKNMVAVDSLELTALPVAVACFSVLGLADIDSTFEDGNFDLSGRFEPTLLELSADCADGNGISESSFAAGRVSVGSELLSSLALERKLAG